MHKSWQRPFTAAEVAATSCDPERFGRNLRDWQHELQRISSRKQFANRIQQPPALMKNRLQDAGQCDACLASYVDWLCQRHGLPAPEWVNDPQRAATKAWYDYPPLWQDAFIHAPGPFRRRGVFTRPEDVLRFRRGRPRQSEAHKRQQNAERQRRYRERIRQKLKQCQ